MAVMSESKPAAGLKTLVRADLKMRGLKYDKKAPQGVPNRKASKKLEARRKAWSADKAKHQRTCPGSYNLKRG